MRTGRRRLLHRPPFLVAVTIPTMGSRRRGGIDFDKLEATRRRLGLPDDIEEWPTEFDDPAFSRRVLGLESE